MELTLRTQVTEFPGIGPARAKKLEKLGIRTAEDLLRYFPRDYEDRRTMVSIVRAMEGEPVCIRAMVAETPRLSRIRRGLDLVKVKAVDHSGMLNITYFNQAYLKDALRPGEEYIFYGKVESNGRTKQMTNPVTEPVGKNAVTGCILPVYPLTAGITNNLLASLTRRVAQECANEVAEALPDRVLREYELAQSDFADKTIHAPDSFEMLELARRRLMFEELFYLATGLALLKGRRTGERGYSCPCRNLAPFLKLLPFTPTAARARGKQYLK